MAYTQQLFGALLIALAITLSIAAPASPAAACGGYGALDPDEASIRQAALSAALASHWTRSRRFVVTILERGEADARVRVHDAAAGDGWSAEYAVRRTGSGWVVSPPTSAAVARR